MSQPEREPVQASPASQVPPAGEEIHIPAPTALPLFTAVGITLTLIGITTFIELTDHRRHHHDRLLGPLDPGRPGRIPPPSPE